MIGKKRGLRVELGEKLANKIPNFTQKFISSITNSHFVKEDLKF
jgi:hypothetical protein